MNKVLKKLLSLTFIFIFAFVAFDVNVNAETEENVTDIGVAKYKVEEVTRETNLPYGVKQHTEIGYTSAAAGEVTNMGLNVTESFIANKYYQQQVNILEIPSSADIKITPWAYVTSGAWNTRTVKLMAQDFEEKNPGYKVIAAINGDGFDINSKKLFPKTPNSAHVSGGEFYKSLAGRVIGFKNDGSSDPLVGNISATRSSNMTLSVYDASGNIVKEFTIDKINAEPSGNEISIFYPQWRLKTGMASQRLEPINVSNAFVVNDGEYALPITNKNVTDHRDDTGLTTEDFYGRGVITNIGNATLDTGDFAIKSTNPEVIAALKVGVKIRAQYHYTNPELQGVNDIIGEFSFSVMYDGELTGKDTNRHPRTMVGMKADGTIIMGVIDGRQPKTGMYGASSSEMAAILTHYGAIEGYNLDGGGSSTMIILNDGEFEVTNSPSDGYERSDSNCLLITVKVPTVELDVVSSTDSLNISTNITNSNGIDIKELWIELNGEKKQVVDNKVAFTNLKSDTEYSYKLYNKDGSEYKDLVVSGRVKTAKLKPVLKEITIILDSNNNLTLNVNIDDPNDTILRQSVTIGDEKVMISNGKATFENFKGNVLDAIINLLYDAEDADGRVELNIDDLKFQCGSDVAADIMLKHMKDDINDLFK